MMAAMKPSSATTEILNWALARITADPKTTGEAMTALSQMLCETHRAQAPAEWAETVAACRMHPLCALLHEDPLTKRTFTQPRGYAGDAELLDIIYRRDWRGVEMTPTRVGQAIFNFTICCRAPSAVRQRRELLAKMIDEACGRTASPHILSVACGHLRELALSGEFRAGKVGRFVGLDQDALSLAEVARSLPDVPVETVPGSIKLLFGSTLAKEKFDFIYTAGLYDYLDEKFAQRLTKRMFEMLRPGGRLLVVNFRPGVEDVGYMEAFMNWKLIYRDTAAMERLSAGVSSAALARQHLSDDPTKTLVFLELDRKT
jgi:extracellular factor (EF) 3-hydroxypalmitic acid methyl ester biosynthesis protein